MTTLHAIHDLPEATPEDEFRFVCQNPECGDRRFYQRRNGTFWETYRVWLDEETGTYTDSEQEEDNHDTAHAEVWRCWSCDTIVTDERLSDALAEGW